MLIVWCCFWLQAMLYATEGVEEQNDFNKAMVGVASVWYVCLFPSPLAVPPVELTDKFIVSSGMRETRSYNFPSAAAAAAFLPPFLTQAELDGLLCLRCNRHLLGFGQRIKKSIAKAGLIGYQFGTVGVSDGISMGTFGMSYSVRTRSLTSFLPLSASSILSVSFS
jgi:hypothetical protein